jgi:ribosomal protein S12 methylthiotransferase accessory factor
MAFHLQSVLRFKHHLRVEPLDEERVFLIGEQERFMLQGRLHALVAPLIDGQRSTAELLSALAGKASPPEILYTLMVLEQRGYLAENVPGMAPEVLAFWQSIGLDARRVMERLQATPVSVVAPGGLAPEPLISALESVGIQVDAGAPLRLVAVEDYLLPRLEVLNREASASKSSWMLVKPTGTNPWIGPIFRPGEGPCWECLAHRLRANRPLERFVQRQRGLEGPLLPPGASVGAGTEAALHLAAVRLAQWIVGGSESVPEDRLIELELRRLRTSEHRVLRRPQCAVCGDPELMRQQALQPVALVSRPKRFTEDGGYRHVPPEETLARHEHHISAITGVVSSMGPVAERDHPLRPVYAAAYFLCPTNPRPAFTDFARPSLGKGRTATQSRASALCEALERYSAIHQGDELLVRGRLSELEGALHPDELQAFSERQFQRREEINAAVTDPRKRVPLRFDERVPISWAPAWSLTHGRRRHLPAAYCYVNLPVPPEEQFCFLNPNGHAAGNSLEEAILQGFLELAERDAVGIWWYNQLPRPSVDLASFGQPYFLELEAHYRSMGFKIWVLDVTNDLQTPAFVALARHQDTGRYCVGFGCHLEARLGVQRALTELNQFFDLTKLPLLWEESEVKDSSFLFPDPSVRARTAQDFPAAQHEDIREDVQTCIDRAGQLGLEVVVMNQTRPDLGLSVAKVVVPGLRHFWPRLGPGRLYDVPVRLGWRAQPLSEEALNSVPLYL